MAVSDCGCQWLVLHRPFKSSPWFPCSCEPPLMNRDRAMPQVIRACRAAGERGECVDTGMSTAFCLLFDDNPNTTMAETKTHERQVLEHLSSLDQHLLSPGHLLGSVLGAGTTELGRKLPPPPLARARGKLCLVHQKMPWYRGVVCFMKSTLGRASKSSLGKGGRGRRVSLSQCFLL